MADNKVLKGINFPGLEGTYYIPEAKAVKDENGYIEIQSYVSDTVEVKNLDVTLTKEGFAADAKAVGDAHADIRAEISQLSEEKVNKSGLTLGIHTDGLVYIFVDGVPHGNGLNIKADVIEGDVFGYVDDNNVIVLNGALAEGTYTIKYEMDDGSTVEIGDLVLDKTVYYAIANTLTNCTNSNITNSIAEGGSYSATITANSGYELSSIKVTMGGTDISSTAVSGGNITIANVTGNIVITAVATEVQTNDTDNILTNGAYTIEMNKRWSNSSKSYRACDGMICITIPTADVLNKTIYFKGFTKDLQSSGSKALWIAVDESLTKQSVPRSANSDGCIWGATYLTDEGNGAYSLAVNRTNFTGDVSSTTYLKLNMAVNASAAVTSLDGLTMTIDKPIS